MLVLPPRKQDPDGRQELCFSREGNVRIATAGRHVSPLKPQPRSIALRYHSDLATRTGYVCRE